MNIRLLITHRRKRSAKLRHTGLWKSQTRLPGQLRELNPLPLSRKAANQTPLNIQLHSRVPGWFSLAALAIQTMPDDSGTRFAQKDMTQACRTLCAEIRK